MRSKKQPAQANLPEVEPSERLIPDFERKGPVFLAEERALTIPGESNSRVSSSRVIMDEAPDGAIQCREFFVVTSGVKTIFMGYDDFLAQRIDNGNREYIRRDLGDNITEIYTLGAKQGPSGEDIATVDYFQYGDLIDPVEGLRKAISEAHPAS